MTWPLCMALRTSAVRSEGTVADLVLCRLVEGLAAALNPLGDEVDELAEGDSGGAKQLEGDKNSDGSGGGDGGGSPPQEDKDFEFMLKVMRMIQKEQDIRSRTRALEDLKRSLKLQKSQPPLQ